MLDRIATTAPARTAPRQRVAARAGVAFGTRDGRTVLTRLAQQGSAKALLPRVHRDAPEVVFLNTAGGLTGGDRLAFDVTLAPGARAVATTQTAERAYGSLTDADPAALDVQIDVGRNARLDWMPQETILFDRAALHRRTRADLTGDAELLFCETIVLGRAAMGEVVTHLDFRDLRDIRRDGVPVLMEPLRLTTETLTRRHSTAGLKGAAAIATVALIAPDAPALVPRLLPLASAVDGVQAAVSGWDGKLVLRALSPSATPLRRWLRAALTDLRRKPLPRVWAL